MVNHSIKVYARLKNQGKNEKTVVYEIVKKEQKFDDIIIYNNLIQQGSYPYNFRFHKVLDEKCNQEDVFDNVAKPVVNSVLQGFNGTIFAYGQTGSGKTYSITGSPKNYNDRGIIPRSIQYVFAQNEKVAVKPTIYISYMEIYNEIGYDLLSSRHDNTARSLEELPRIVLLEDSDGEVHMRNLSVLPVTTEQEAMRLLFLGDTNRTIAETPMNEYSSRSHCIFTIYITFRDEPSNVLRYSKLHLVDLAGSERVCKSLTTGTALREAKHINLSLHYLQQVILALSESKRIHIPYRNSMMTYILKDSLSGNCLTAMLATLALNKDNIQETISTCRFAQRVSMISTAPVINEMRDPQKEIAFLRSTVEELRKQVSLLSNLSFGSILDKNQEEQCRKEVDKFLTSPCEELKIDPSMSHIQFCFKLMKSKINSQNLENREREIERVQSQKELSVLQSTVDKQEEEINNLRKIIDDIPEHPVNPNRFPYKKNNLTIQEIKPIQETNKNVIVNYFDSKQDQYSKNSQQYKMNLSKFNTYISEGEHESEKQLFEKFLKHPENAKDIHYYTQNLQKKLEMAKVYADTIEQCQKNITFIRQQLQTRSNNSVKNRLLMELEEQQKIYSKSLDDLKTVKNETYHLQSGLKKAEIKTVRAFKSWLDSKQSLTFSELDASGSKDSAVNTDKTDFCKCKSSHETLRKSSTEECCCEKQVEKKMSFDCSSRVPTNCWANYLCLGPVCQPLVMDQNQCCDHSTTCSLESIDRISSKMFPTDRNHRILHRSDILCDAERIVHFKKVPKTKTCHSCSFIPQNRNWNTNLPDLTENDNRCYCCEKINSDHQNREEHFGDRRESILDNCEEYEGNPCCKYITSDPSLKSITNIEECCKYPFPSLADNYQIDDNHQGTNHFEDQHSNDNCIAQEEQARQSNLIKETDSVEFREFMKTVPLSGDTEIDKEIFNFYRNKFCS